MSLTLDPEQKRALRTAVASSSSLYVIHGRAGTGKTTLLAEMQASLACAVLAPTNKAAQVLRSKGVAVAQTAHSYLYTPSTQGTQQEISDLRDEIASLQSRDPSRPRLLERLRELRKPAFSPRSRSAPASVLIVDEVSMISRSVGEDLVNAAEQIIAFGDPWQLPPVQARPWLPPTRADITLTHVHRQAEGSSIVDMALYAHKHGRVTAFPPDTRVLTPASPDKYASRLLRYTGDDTLIITGTHFTRRLINHVLREQLSLPPIPIPGDTLICTRSPSFVERDLGLVNGYTYTVRDSASHDGWLALTLVEPLSGVRFTYTCSQRGFLISSLPLRANMRHEDTLDEAPPLDFAYAVTAHKAQGDQRPHILIVDESSVFAGMREKWLYTAVTRASESVVVVQRPPRLPAPARAYTKGYV